MMSIPTQRTAGSAQIYQNWERAGLGPDSVVDVGDGSSMTLGELLGEDIERESEDE